MLTFYTSCIKHKTERANTTCFFFLPALRKCKYTWELKNLSTIRCWITYLRASSPLWSLPSSSCRKLSGGFTYFMVDRSSFQLCLVHLTVLWSHCPVSCSTNSNTYSHCGLTCPPCPPCPGWRVPPGACRGSCRPWAHPCSWKWCSRNPPGSSWSWLRLWAHPQLLCPATTPPLLSEQTFHLGDKKGMKDKKDPDGSPEKCLFNELDN